MLPFASGNAIPVVAGARQPAAGDRVEDVASGVAVDELERLAGGDDGRVTARVGQREVALAVEEAADVDLVRPRPVGQRRRAGVRARAPAVVIVLRQVAVGQDAGHRDVRAERVRAAGRAPRRGHRHDRHRLVPRRPRRVVRAVDREDVALAHADAPARRRRGHRDVPGDGARGLEVVGAGAEQQHGPVAARQREVGVQAARVQVAGDARRASCRGRRPTGCAGTGRRTGPPPGRGTCSARSRRSRARRRRPGRPCRPSRRPSRCRPRGCGARRAPSRARSPCPT